MRPGDRALINKEPRLPGLATLLDDDAFAELLETWLPGAGIRGARSTYVRYKPNTSCLVAYCVQTAAGEQLVHARAERDDAGGRLWRLSALAERPTALGPGALVIEEHSLAVLPFPTDRRLPALRAIADDGLRGHVFGSDGPLQILAYKPERRLVARAGDVVLRAYASDGWPAAAGAVAAVGRARDLRVPELRRVVDAHQVLAVGWMPGRPVHELLGAAGPVPAASVAAALHALHTCTPAGTLPTRRGAWDAGAVAAAAAAAAVAGPHVGRRARRLADRLGGELTARPPGGAVLHGDFSVDQVVLDDDGAVLLDLDSIVRGHAVDDLASCLGDLELRVIDGRLERRQADAFGAELVDAYGVETPLACRERELSVLTAAALLRRVAEPFRRRQPDWPVATERVVERASDLVRRPARTRHSARVQAPLDRLERLERPAGASRALPAGPLVLRRAWPSGRDRILLEYAGADGGIVAGEWHRGGVANGAVIVHAAPGVPVGLFPGADPDLPALASVLRRRGATLTSHRRGRRATVRVAAAREELWVKVVAPGRATALAETLERARLAAADAFAVPAVRRVGAKAGTVTCNPLPGRPLTEALAQRGTHVHVHRLGRALRDFHAGPAPVGAAPHGAEAEAAVVTRWIDKVVAVAPEIADRAAAEAAIALPALTALEPARSGPLHRDLHDGQIVLATDGAIGVLDFDTLAVGDPALDVANLLVHLDLRAAQGVCTVAQALHLREALLWGYDADAELLRRVAVHEAATRIRLACVYGFRPRWRDLPAMLLNGLQAERAGSGAMRSRAWIRASSSANENGLVR